MAEKNMQFEEALRMLEAVVTRLETGNVSLDEALAAYEEGVALIRFCNEKLDEAEQRVLAVHKTEGGHSLAPFAGGEA